MLRPGLALVCLLGLLAGCSDYEGDFEYVPRTAIAEVPTPGPQGPPAATAYATVDGVRLADRSLGIPYSVEIRFQIQNGAPEQMTMDPRSLVLSDGTMLNFPPPVGIPQQPAILAPGQTASMVAYFPFLPGRSSDNTQMSPLRLQWAVQIGTQTFPQSVYFTRVFPYYYYGPYYGPAPYPPVFFSGTFVYVHRR
jgi:hypothetical protein